MTASTAATKATVPVGVLAQAARSRTNAGGGPAFCTSTVPMGSRMMNASGR